jgi:hypothetical protein
MIKLRTWAGESQFSYNGSVKAGTEIYYGKRPYRIAVSSAKYHELLKHFSKNSVNIGTSKTNPPRGSVGEWLQKNVTKTAIASYVGPILIHEGYAEKVDRSEIRFN